MTLKKRTAIIALISLVCAFLLAYLIDEPVAHLVSTIFLTIFVMSSIIVIIYDICQ